MTVSNSWRKAYGQLQVYISKNSDIAIDAGSVAIAEDFRADFYRLFDTVRTLVVKEYFPDLLEESELLSRQYVKAEKDVFETCGIESIVTDTGLGKFLHHPASGLSRRLFDPLFDLLKSKITTEDFESGLSKTIEETFDLYYRVGYQRWVQLSMVTMLEADSFFEVTLRKPGSKEIIKQTPSLENVPSPVKTNRLSFKQDSAPIFVVPDFIFRSGRKNRYVAVRSALTGALRNASSTSEKREWYPVKSIPEFDPDAIFIYVGQSPKEISLVADMTKICRPDLILFCREKKNWFEKNGSEKFKKITDGLKPKSGIYVISRDDIVPRSKIENVTLLSVGLDKIRLSAISDAI